MKRDESNRVYWFSDKILIFSLFVGCFYHKCPALSIDLKIKTLSVIGCFMNIDDL